MAEAEMVATVSENGEPSASNLPLLADTNALTPTATTESTTIKAEDVPSSDYGGLSDVDVDTDWAPGHAGPRCSA